MNFSNVANGLLILEIQFQGMQGYNPSLLEYKYCLPI